jgi:long-chain acyl-CoA synthetase
MQGDLGFDSLSLTELLVALESKFSTIDPKSLSACNTVADVESLVRVVAAPSLRPPTATSRYAIQGRHTTSMMSLPTGVGDVVLPGAVQERGKAAIGMLQDFFYGEMMGARVVGASNIPHNRNVLVVANHTSHLDMGFVRHALGKYGEDIVSLAAQDYFFDREPWKKAFFANFSNLQAIDRKGGLRATERRAREVIESGRTMLIFPEGTRSPDGQIQEFKPLIGHLAMHYGVDILPMYLSGTHESMPKGSRIPTKRGLVARVGPVFSVADMKRLTSSVSPMEASREVAKLARLAVLALKDEKNLDFSTLGLAEAEAAAEAARENPLVVLFRELSGKFAPETVNKPVSFYFTLGQDDTSKWTVLVNKERCDIQQGKPASGTADCVLKTSPEMFTRIVREGYIPGASEFMTGLVKSNDVGLLLEFQRFFQLGEATS